MFETYWLAAIFLFSCCCLSCLPVALLFNGIYVKYFWVIKIGFAVIKYNVYDSRRDEKRISRTQICSTGALVVTEIIFFLNITNDCSSVGKIWNREMPTPKMSNGRKTKSVVYLIKMNIIRFLNVMWLSSLQLQHRIVTNEGENKKNSEMFYPLW